MSTPLEQQQPPSVELGNQQAYTTHTVHGSIGPVIAIVAVITILGVIAGMIGRLCSGRPIMGHSQYNFEGWVEKKCSSCLDGRVDTPPPRPTEELPVAAQQEIKVEGHEQVADDQLQGQTQHGSSS